MYDPMSEIHKRVTIDTKTGCWIWLKSCNSAGYGQFTLNKVYWTAHRYSYTFSKGSPKGGDIVRHLCHNPKCCNPDHLEKGTHKDNWRDSEEVHRVAKKKQRKSWIIKGVDYKTSRNATEKTGLSISSLMKYTDPITRVFNEDSYREACKIAGWKPKI